MYNFITIVILFHFVLVIYQAEIITTYKSKLSILKELGESQVFSLIITQIIYKTYY